MYRSKIFLAVSLALAVFGLGSSALSQGNRDKSNFGIRTTESYAVYSAILRKMINSPENGDSVDLLVINKKTSTDNIFENWGDKVFRKKKAAVSRNFWKAQADYKLRNKKSGKLINSFALTTKYILIDQKEFNDFFKKDNLKEDWENFFHKYPNSPGFITFSRIGFDKGYKHAFVYREVNCGMLCAGGSYILLKKTANGWEQIKEILFWAS